MKSRFKRLFWWINQSSLLKNIFIDRLKRFFPVGPIYKKIYKKRRIIRDNHSALRILSAFKEKIGDTRGRVLFIHSSIDTLGIDLDGIPAVVALFERWVGFEGTIVMPVFSYSLGQNAPFTEVATFDVERTPAETGVIPELFRRKQGVLRSLHPTHSVAAYGKFASEIISHHHEDVYPFGEKSPFYKILRMGGIIVGLGVEWYRCLTALHVVEDLMKEDFPVCVYLKRPVVFNVRDRKGRLFRVNTFVHDNRIYRYMNPLRIRRYLVNSGALKEMLIEGKPMFVADAEKLNRVVLSLAKKNITIYG